MENQGSSQKTVGKKSIFSGIGGIGGWFAALSGKPKAPPPSQGSNEPSQNNSKINTPQEETIREDSIIQDISKLRKFLGGLSSKAKVSAKPAMMTSEQTKEKAVQGVNKIVDKGVIKKIVSIFVVIFFLMILIFVGTTLFKKVKENGKEKPKESGEFISPTPIEYVPYKPSVYSKDPEVLNLEEEVKVLEKELTTTNIREERLNPPTLDFSIKF